VRALDAPIAELEQQLGAAREGLTQAQAGLVSARQTNADTTQTLQGARARNDEIRVTAEKGIRLRLTSTGTLLNLHRLDTPQYRVKLGPIYARLDELKHTATAREARIAALDAERRGYDRSAMQRGLIAVGGALGAFLLLLVIVIVIVAR
jgi:chromosome segregation ATPase